MIDVQEAAAARDAPIEVVNIPYTDGNPYQRLLYGGAPGACGPFAQARGRKGWLGALGAGESCPAIVHLHWDDRIFGRDRDEEANALGAQAILDDFRRYRARGGRLIWTIHNRVAHREIDSAAFHAARAALCEIADIVHVHAPHAAAHMVEEYGLAPEKIRIVRVPSYLGVYEPADVTLARGAAEGAGAGRAFLHFGIVRENKGLDTLAEAARRLAKRRADWRLRVVGRVFAGQRGLARDLAAIDGVEMEGERIPDEAVAPLFAGAEIFVAPFRGVFTSSSIVLAQTFGLPIIGPDCVELRQSVPPENVDLLYSGDRPKDLVRALELAADMPAEELARRRAACFAYARETAPTRIGAAFADALRSAMEAPE